MQSSLNGRRASKNAFSIKPAPSPKAGANGKKKLTWGATYGTVTVTELIGRSQERSYVRLLPERLNIQNRSCSLPLQRPMVWQGAHQSFEQAAQSFQELHGFEMPTSTVREHCLGHAQAIEERQRAQEEEPYRLIPETGVPTLVAQADGSMVCTVAPDLPRQGERPREWKQINVACAQAQGSESPYYAVSFESQSALGAGWGHCARKAGWGQNTHVHVVCDGAPHLTAAAQEVFGEGTGVLLDFYHASQYLAQAGEVIAPGAADAWRREQQERLKAGQWKEVAEEMRPWLEPEETPAEQAPVRRAYAYLDKRSDQLFYDEAQAADLPIGSGQVESAHRHLIQDRLKRAGAVWLPKSAEAMGRLRAALANGEGAAYWGKLKSAA